VRLRPATRPWGVRVGQRSEQRVGGLRHAVRDAVWLLYEALRYSWDIWSIDESDAFKSYPLVRAITAHGVEAVKLMQRGIVNSVRQSPAPTPILEGSAFP
jgi:hypothetical protein